MKPRLSKNNIAAWASIIGCILAIILFIWDRETLINFFKSISFSWDNAPLGIIIILTITWIIQLSYNLKKSRASQRKIITYFKNYIDSNYGKEYIKNVDSSLISKVENSMKDLVRHEQTKVLEPDIYYLYLFSLLSGAQRRIWAVSIMGEDEWIDTPEETEFQRLNLDASSRQVRVERIFVVSKSDAKKIPNTKNVIEQINKRDNYLLTFIVFKEDIPSKITNSIGNGFLAFDDYAIAEDVFDGEYIRGRLFIDLQNINSYDRLYNNLRDYAVPLDTKFISTL